MGNRFLAFFLFEGFFCLRKSFVPLLKFQIVFRDEDEKRIVSTALKDSAPPTPLSIPKTEDKIQQFFLQKQALTLSGAQTRLHQSGGYKQQHEAYTNNHTRLHMYSLLISPHQKLQNFSIIPLSAFFFREHFCTARKASAEENRESLNSCRIK